MSETVAGPHGLFDVLVHFFDFLFKVFAQFRSFGLHGRGEKVVLDGELLRMKVDIFDLQRTRFAPRGSLTSANVPFRSLSMNSPFPDA